jgi:hypothetical protein
MPQRITIRAADQVFTAELNDSRSAAALLARLPLTVRMSRWGDEYYGSVGICVEPEREARTGMAVGELAIWPDGRALCIFFGPTPVSAAGEPRAYSDVNPIGRLLEDAARLRAMGGSVDMHISRAARPESAEG